MDMTKKFPFFANVKEVSADKGPFKRMRVEADGHEFSVQVLEPYGLQSSPIKGGQVAIIPMDGDMSKCLAIAMPPPADRVDGQKEGEVTLRNHKAGQNFKFDEDGTATLETPKDIIFKSGGIIHFNPE